jgi:hypothetical protein
MKQKNLKFDVSTNTPHPVSKVIGGMVGVIAVGWLIGIGIALATWMMPLSTQVVQ